MYTICVQNCKSIGPVVCAEYSPDLKNFEKNAFKFLNFKFV